MPPLYSRQFLLLQLWIINRPPLMQTTGVALWWCKEVEFQYVLLMFEVPRYRSPRFVAGSDRRNRLLRLSNDDITLEVKGSCYI
ncbi:hypothetical protein HAX54_037658 [Datura stramonium]|uniref:Uncharacterized protein n=1 Tax=Datura stramonium TaxID=4076 RepID=A0ABS8VK80_DATST|nr:hypothetical protein [Datura stramonium]